MTENNNSLPRWPTVLAVLLLAACAVTGLLVLLNSAGAAALETELLKNTARGLSIACGLAAALIYALLRKQHRARAALLGNLALVGGLLALGALQLLDSGPGGDAVSGHGESRQEIHQ